MKTCLCCLFPQAGLLLRFQVAGYTVHVQYVGREMNSNKFMLQGSKQVPSGSAGQVDFLAGQVRLTCPLRVKTTDPLIESLTEKSKR